MLSAKHKMMEGDDGGVEYCTCPREDDDGGVEYCTCPHEDDDKFGFDY